MKQLLILIIVAVVVFAVIFAAKVGIFGLSLSQHSVKGGWFLPVVAVSALIDSVNPCAFSVLLLTIAFLFSLGELKSGILKIGAFYIFGLFIVYVLIGLGILQVLNLFNIPHFMAKIGATILIVIGLTNLLGHFCPSFPIKFHIPASAHKKMAQLMKKGSIPTAFGLGVLVGLFEFPCTGGPYLVVLGLLHDGSTYLSGLAYLLFYNLIFIIPLALVLLVASDKAVLDRVQNWRKEKAGNIRLWSGIAMILLGLLIFIL